MFIGIDKIIKRRQSTDGYYKLKPIDALDIANLIGEGVVVGGVRRTSEVGLIDSDDEECIIAKENLYKQENGEWVVDKNIIHRQMSNNSIFYESKPTRERLHWQIEKMRYSGEPAWISAEGARKRRPNFHGGNPCMEILLNNKGLCNLTTLNVMAFVIDGKLNKDELLKAQSLSARASYRMTNVELELPKWDAVQKEERLTGCSLTGWQDMVNATNMSTEDQIELLKEMREVAHTEVKSLANKIGANPSLLVTTVKPEGTLSQLPTVSSGVHYSHSPYYIRRVRINSHDALVKVCEDLGYTIKPEVGQDLDTCRTKVIEFPVKAPNGITKYDVSAIKQLENYKMFMENYVDHNCSITVHVRNNEWDDVEQWIWDNWDSVIAVSFLSLDDSFYQLMPYEAIDEKTYLEMSSKIQGKSITPDKIAKYEVVENDIDMGNDGCDAGACPVR
jgi:ribonucleoside-diphosphate reductase alpha chain/ribonucleoside-triphosphate reductase